MSGIPTCEPHCEAWPLCGHDEAAASEWAEKAFERINAQLDKQNEIEACPVCGATGPCGYDAEGRPLVHTTVFPTAATGSEAT